MISSLHDQTINDSRLEQKQCVISHLFGSTRLSTVNQKCCRLHAAMIEALESFQIVFQLGQVSTTTFEYNQLACSTVQMASLHQWMLLPAVCTPVISVEHKNGLLKVSPRTQVSDDGIQYIAYLHLQYLIIFVRTQTCISLYRPYPSLSMLACATSLF